MLAVAELYTRRDAIEAALTKVEAKARRILAERNRLQTESANITAGIEAIGVACGLFTKQETQP